MAKAGSQPTCRPAHVLSPFSTRVIGLGSHVTTNVPCSSRAMCYFCVIAIERVDSRFDVTVCRVAAQPSAPGNFSGARAGPGLGGW